jgi:hypothetical protein
MLEEDNVSMDSIGVLLSKDRISTSVFCHITGMPSQMADVGVVIVIDVKLGIGFGVTKGA